VKTPFAQHNKEFVVADRRPMEKERVRMLNSVFTVELVVLAWLCA
jgi:hypothetical protein